MSARSIDARGSLLSGLALALSLIVSGCSASYVIAYAPCEDPSCGDGQSCVAGACVACGQGPLCQEALPPFDAIRVDTRGDTAVIEFAPVLDAVDYRIYPMPEPDAVEHDAAGHLIVRDAIYRCAGKRTVADRAEQYGALFSESLIARDNGYTRSEAEATLGHVFAHAGPGRLPVVRMADPSGHGGYFNAEWIPPLYYEANSAEYVIGPARRAELLRAGFRDDGIAFYVPERGLAVYRAEYAPDAHQGTRVSLFFSEGREYDARSTGEQSQLLDLGLRFHVHATPQADTVPLRRVTYRSGATFDVLAAGEAAYQRVLHQAGPVTSLTWSGLSGPTVLVIEALDAGCPFPNGYVGASQADAPAAPTGVRPSYPTDTLDALRLPETGEVFVNGQHDPQNRPNPIARSFVPVVPRALPALAFSSSFSDPHEFDDMERHEDATATVYRNARWSVEITSCEPAQFSFGAVLGQLFLGMPQCRVSLVPRGFVSRIAQQRFLHVRMASDLPSTGRRYPQLLITTAHSPEVSEVASAADLVIHNRLGPLAAAELPGAESSIVVQPYFSYHEAQIQFCGQRGWGPTVRCPRANLYGYNAGEPNTLLPDEPWLPVPVVSDRVGFDRPVQLDVYASTERVYLFLDGRPTGCAVLPPGQMPAGEVTVAFRAIIDEPEKDELIRLEPGRSYEREFSQLHSDRRMDDLGIALDVPAPSWDETVLPCATRWFGGELIEN